MTERAAATPHELVNPTSLAPPSGFSHAVAAARGRTVYLGGQAPHGRDGVIASESLVEQFDAAASNVVEALGAVGGAPEHLVAMQIFVTDARAYRDALEDIGASYRRHFGRHYPAIALVEVTSLFDPKAKVELVCTAVIPDSPPD